MYLYTIFLPKSRQEFRGKISTNFVFTSFIPIAPSLRAHKVCVAIYFYTRYFLDRQDRFRDLAMTKVKGSILQ